MTEDIDIERIRSGDAKAFRTLFERYYFVLKRFALKYLHNEDTAKDIAQESLLKYWDRRRRFKDLWSVSSFLFVTVRNAVYDELRHRKVVVGSKDKILSELEHDYISLYEEDTVKAMYRRLEKEIDLLPRRTGQIMRLHLEGLKESEIAEVLDIGKETVRTLKKKGSRMLKEQMEECRVIWDTHHKDFQA